MKDCLLDELRGFHADQEDDEYTFVADNRTGWTADD